MKSEVSLSLVDRSMAILWPPIVVFGLHVLRVRFFPDANQLDMVAHFSGGFAMALSAFLVYRELIRSKSIPKLPYWFAGFCFLTAAELVGVLWEFFEFYIANTTLPYFQMMLPDTISDLTLDLAGAVLCSCLIVFGFSRRFRDFFI